MKLTPWFPPDVKPVHVGWYETNNGIGPNGHSYWRGFKWSGTYFRNFSLVELRSLNYSGAVQRKHWRGLAEKP